MTMPDLDNICVDCWRLFVISSVILWCLPSLFTTQDCGRPPQIRYASVDLSPDLQQAAYRCERWYLFPDGNRTQTISCLAGAWQPLHGTCLPGLCAPEWTRYKTSCFQFRHQRQSFSAAQASCGVTSSTLNQSIVGLDQDTSDEHFILAAMPKRARYLKDIREYFIQMIKQYNRSAIATEELSGTYWVNLFPPDERVRVRTDQGRRLVVAEGEAAVILVNITETGLNVDLVFDTMDKQHYYLCQDHIYCPSIKDEDDKSRIFTDKMVQPHDDKSLCPNSQLEVTCRDGLWRYMGCSEPDVPVYTYTTCPPLNDSLASHPSHDKNHVGSTVDVFCNSGYHYDDKSDAKRFTCNASGIWIPELEFCLKDILCPPPNSSLASVTCNTSLTEALPMLTVRKCECQEKRMFADSHKTKISVCQEEGKWDTDLGDGCTAFGTNCPIPPPLPNAVIIGAVNKSYHVNTSVYYICNDGMQFEDETRELTVLCPMDGLWKIPFMQGCEEIVCDSINKVRYLLKDLVYHQPGIGELPDITGEFEDHVRQPFQRQIYSECRNGTFPDGSLNRTSVCNDHGRWAPAVGLCGDYEIPQTKRRIRKYTPPPVEAPGSSAIGSIAMIFVLIFMGGIFILDLINIKNALVMMFKNVRSFCRFYCITTKVKYTKTPVSQVIQVNEPLESESEGEYEKSHSPSISSILSNHVGKYDPHRETGAHLELLPNGFRDNMTLADDNSSSSQISTKFEGESEMAAMSFESEESLHDVDDELNDSVTNSPSHVSQSHVSVNVSKSPPRDHVSSRDKQSPRDPRSRDKHVIGNGPDTAANDHVVLV